MPDATASKFPLMCRKVFCKDIVFKPFDELLEKGNNPFIIFILVHLGTRQSDEAILGGIYRFCYLLIICGWGLLYFAFILIILIACLFF